MTNPESRLVRQILEKLGDEFPASYFRKIHGNPYQHAGIPDIIGCVQGLFFAFEVKTEIGKSSKIQVLEGQFIIQAGGVHAEIRSAKEAIRIIKGQLRA